MADESARPSWLRPATDVATPCDVDAYLRDVGWPRLQLAPAVQGWKAIGAELKRAGATDYVSSKDPGSKANKRAKALLKLEQDAEQSAAEKQAVEAAAAAQAEAKEKERARAEASVLTSAFKNVSMPGLMRFLKDELPSIADKAVQRRRWHEALGREGANPAATAGNVLPEALALIGDVEGAEISSGAASSSSATPQLAASLTAGADDTSSGGAEAPRLPPRQSCALVSAPSGALSTGPVADRTLQGQMSGPSVAMTSCANALSSSSRSASAQREPPALSLMDSHAAKKEKLQMSLDECRTWMKEEWLPKFDDAMGAAARATPAVAEEIGDGFEFALVAAGVHTAAAAVMLTNAVTSLGAVQRCVLKQEEAVNKAKAAEAAAKAARDKIAREGLGSSTKGYHLQFGREGFFFDHIKGAKASGDAISGNFRTQINWMTTHGVTEKSKAPAKPKLALEKATSLPPHDVVPLGIMKDLVRNFEADIEFGIGLCLNRPHLCVALRLVRTEILARNGASSSDVTAPASCLPPEWAVAEPDSPEGVVAATVDAGGGGAASSEAPSDLLVSPLGAGLLSSALLPMAPKHLDPAFGSNAARLRRIKCCSRCCSALHWIAESNLEFIEQVPLSEAPIGYFAVENSALQQVAPAPKLVSDLLKRVDCDFNQGMVRPFS